MKILLTLLFAVVACSDKALTCPYTGRGGDAPSAGCFAASEDGLLLVRGLNGKVSLPGEINPPLSIEVRAAFYLPADQFDKYGWRYEEEQEVLKKMLLNTYRTTRASGDREHGREIIRNSG